MFWKVSRFTAAIVFGGATSSYWNTFQSTRGNGGHDWAAYCAYKGVIDPIHIKSKTSPLHRQVFSGRYKEYTLAEIIPVSHDVALFRFLLQHPEDEFNLKPCSTLQACFRTGTMEIEKTERFYTPVTANGTKGYFDIIVKRKKEGKMTDHLFGLHVGDTLLFRLMAFKIKYRPNRWKEVGLIAGGTGFTPMLQVIRHALTDPMEEGVIDKTKLSFLFCNRTEKHILLKGLFDKLASEHADRFRVNYVVDQALKPAEWKGWTGYVSKEMVQKCLPPPAEGNFIMVCGPDSLLNHVAGTPMGATECMSSGKSTQPVALDANNLTVLGGVLRDCGFNGNQVFRF